MADSKPQGASHRRLQHLRQCVLIVLSATLIAMLPIRSLSPLKSFESWWHDWVEVYNSPLKSPPTDVIFVAINEETLSLFPYRSPINRAFLAQSIDQLMQKGVKHLAVDLLFDQASDPEADDILKATLRRYKDRLVVARADAKDGLSPAQTAYQRDFLSDIPAARANLAKRSGDGVVEWIFQGDQSLPSFAYKMSAKDADLTKAPRKLVYPSDKDGHPIRLKRFDAQALPFLPADWFQDKWVVLGVDLSDIDRHRTPFSSVLDSESGDLPGAEIHGLAIDQLLKDITPHHLTEVQAFALCALLAMLGLSLVIFDTIVTIKLSLMVIGLATVMGVSFWAWGSLMLMIDVVAPSAALLTSFAISNTVMRRQDRLKRRFLREAFSKFVSPEVVAILLKDPTKLRLRGERRFLTFLFCDLAGFTTLCETYPPEKVVPVINTYTDRISKILISYGATIDKYAGDGIDAFFGAPLDDPDHARHAVLAGLEIEAYGRAYAAEQQAKGIQLGLTRIGVHTGSAIVGNFGSEERLSYSACGDAINTAARLESLNKYIGSHFCISHDCIELAGDIAEHFIPVGRFVLKGKAEPVGVYVPIVRDWSADFVAGYRKAYALLATSDPTAGKVFEGLLDQFGSNFILDFHLKRFAQDGRDDIIVMSEK